MRFHLPYHKALRLVLPFSLLLCGFVIFICGLLRTYHLGERLAETSDEKKILQSQNDYFEWWIGFTVIISAVLSIIAVFWDHPMLYKISVVAFGICFVLTMFSLVLDAGELSWISRNYKNLQSLKREGFNCSTITFNYTIHGHNYNFRECRCKRNKEIGLHLYVIYSCELLKAEYFLHMILAFFTACTIGFALFTLGSFVLILKRISQITTALHLDEKPLSEDFANLHEDLYIS